MLRDTEKKSKCETGIPKWKRKQRRKINFNLRIPFARTRSWFLLFFPKSHRPLVEYFSVWTRMVVQTFYFTNLTTRTCVSLRSQFNGPRTFHRFLFATCTRAREKPELKFLLSTGRNFNIVRSRTSWIPNFKNNCISSIFYTLLDSILIDFECNAGDSFNEKEILSEQFVLSRLSERRLHGIKTFTDDTHCKKQHQI